MTNEELLKKAIEKAIKNGYKPSGVLGAVLRGEIGIGLDPNIYKHLLKNNQYYVYIFSQDFAKAFWGEELTQVESVTGEYLLDDAYDDEVSYYDLPAYQCHLQQLVLAKDKFKYLEKFL